MAKLSRGISERCDWSGFCHTDRFRGNGHKPCILFLCFQKQANSKFSAKTGVI